MPPATTEQLVSDDTEDVVYKWTVRVLYVSLIGANLWLYWRMVRDDPDFAVAKAKVDQLVAELGKPFRRARDFRRSVGRMHWQALEALDDEGAPDGRP